MRPAARRVAIISAWSLGALALLVLVAGFVATRLLERPQVAAELQAKLSKAVGGEVRWEEFRVRVFPAPRGVLRGLHVETAAATFSTREVTVALQLWPLFVGRAEIASINVAQPVLRMTVVPSAAVPEEARLEPQQNALQAYRAAMTALVDGLQQFAPDTVVALEEGDVEITVEGMPPPELRKLAIRAKTGTNGVEVEATAASRYWTSLRLAGRIEYSDLSSTAELHLARIQGQAWLDWLLKPAGIGVAVPDADLDVRFRGDAAKALELDFDGTAPSMTFTREAQRITAAPIVLKAKLVADGKDLTVHVGEVRAGATKLAGGALHFNPKNQILDAEVGYTLDLVQGLGYAREFAGDALAPVEQASGTLNGRIKAALRGGNRRLGVTVEKSDAALQVKDLPAPVRLEGAAVEAGGKTVNVQSVRVAFLDASVTASAKISDFDKGPRVQGAVADATVGEKLLDWVWQKASISPAFTPKTPIHLAASQYSWSPKSGVDVQATARFDAGPALGVDAAWSAAGLDVRRATIKDRMSNVTLALRTKGGGLEGRYAGTLDSRTIAAMLKSASAPAGAVNGDLRFVVDRKDRQRTQVEGTLKGQDLDLTWLAGKPAKIARLDIAADGGVLRIADATVDWAGQQATLRGEAKRGENGPVVDAQIESPGVLVDALLPKEAGAPKPEKDKPPPNLWPLPVTGKIAVRSKFVQYQHTKVEPLSATITLEEQRALLDVQEAFLCGFALPATLELTPKGLAVAAQVAAQKQKLEDAAHCLSGEKVLLTGAMDVRVDVRTQGQPRELVQNLKGTVSADVRDGQVMKFALLGNILSMQNVVALATQGGPKLGAEGFPFRQLSAKGRFDKGRFVLDEGVFYSNAIGLGANGWISLTDFQTRLTVLVAPLAIVNEAVRKLPLLGYVTGGALTSLPVSVTGDIRDPTVVPLGPRAITSELTGIVQRTITLPGHLLPGESGGKP